MLKNVEETNMSQNTTKEIVQEMDSDISGVGLRLENLNVIAKELSSLRDEMDDKVNDHQEDFMYLGLYMSEVHNKIKLFNDYMNVVLNELGSDLNQTQEKHKKLFQLLVDKQEQ